MGLEPSSVSPLPVPIKQPDITGIELDEERIPTFPYKAVKGRWDTACVPFSEMPKEVRAWVVERCKADAEVKYGS